MVNMTVTEWVNSLTSEEYCRMINIIAPLAEDDAINKMTDQELLDALEA